MRSGLCSLVSWKRPAHGLPLFRCEAEGLAQREDLFVEFVLDGQPPVCLLAVASGHRRLQPVRRLEVVVLRDDVPREDPDLQLGEGPHPGEYRRQLGPAIT